MAHWVEAWGLRVTCYSPLKEVSPLQERWLPWRCKAGHRACHPQSSGHDLGPDHHQITSPSFCPWPLHCVFLVAAGVSAAEQTDHVIPLLTALS